MRTAKPKPVLKGVGDKGREGTKPSGMIVVLRSFIDASQMGNDNGNLEKYIKFEVFMYQKSCFWLPNPIRFEMLTFLESLQTLHM